jgi:alpha-mannosidase
VPLDGGAVREVDLIEWDLPGGPRAAVEDAAIAAAPAGSRHAEPGHDSSDGTVPAE